MIQTRGGWVSVRKNSIYSVLCALTTTAFGRDRCRELRNALQPRLLGPKMDNDPGGRMLRRESRVGGARPSDGSTTGSEARV